MAVPKKKTSPSRRGLRRAGQHHRLQRKYPRACGNCGASGLPHTVCPACGHYKGREVISIPVVEEDEAESEE